MGRTPEPSGDRAVERPRKLSLGGRGRRLPVGGLVRLLVLCLAVGVVLSVLGMGPEDFWGLIWSTVSGLWSWLVGIAGSVVAYVVIGACVVIPIVVVRRLWRRTTR